MLETKRCVQTYDSALEIPHPFLQGRDGHLVKFIDADKNIFRKYIGRHTSHDGIIFITFRFQHVKERSVNFSGLTVCPDKDIQHCPGWG